jgi:hypothetical protein
MKPNDSHPASVARRTARFVLQGTISAVLLLPMTGCLTPSKPEHQTMIHDMGSQVMPFDLSKTLHIFKMNETGGIQQVVVRNIKDNDQISLIRRHLQHEAMRFAEGDFADPSSIHGENMPGIKELEAGASMIKITYSELPNGAQIAFTTQDIHLITAIHSWFGAQLSDHGVDATCRQNESRTLCYTEKWHGT